MTNDQFYKGETVSFSIEVKGRISNAPINPSAITITVIKGKVSGTASDIKKVDAKAMTKRADGKYSYEWISDEIGNYVVIYKADNNGSITMLKDEFIVVPI